MKDKLLRALTRKTIIAGLVIVAAFLAESVLGVDVPGFDFDTTTAGTGLLMIALRLVTKEPVAP